ncbi:protein outspread isoform X3 [Prorops nasuta]|uniref:protein outspread isoform X3 n=1 Tax=Prorops nasuta TaxID=863751 RepID=UPI0034CF18F1
MINSTRVVVATRPHEVLQQVSQQSILLTNALATRKISKCGYLFVAPGWDFSNPLNRTKRWQRRWFVLYDDGELTYSVDEHPETVPQARIDMTRVLEVAAAEDVTGHPYSLAVTSPEGATFVKGTCREETRWWADVLQVYSRNKGRHKRNATFPGGQTSILQVTPTIRSNTPNPQRPRFNSCRSEPRSSSGPTVSWLSESDSSKHENSSLTSDPDNTTQQQHHHHLNYRQQNHRYHHYHHHHHHHLLEDGEHLRSNGSPSRSSPRERENGTLASYLTSNIAETPVSSVSTTSTSSSFEATSKATSTTSDILSSNTVATYTTAVANTNTSTTTSTTAATVTTDSTGSINSLILADSTTLTEKPPIVPSETRSVYRDQPASSASPPTRDKLRAEDKARRRLIQEHRSDSFSGISNNGSSGSNEKLDDDACRRIFLEHEREREGKLRDIAASLTQSRTRRSKPRSFDPTRDVVDNANSNNHEKLIRGDPDGCGLDITGIRYSPTSELRVDLPAEDLLNIKKGWLMKQGANKEWNKHWFVIRGCGLMYYRDPCAEDKGIMDGVIDLNTVTAVTPLQVARNYGFQTVAWDDRGSTVLSAVTAGIRSSWISAIRRAANLPDPDKDSQSSHCQDVHRQDSNPQSPTTSITDRDRESVVPSTSITPRSVLFSSDEEYRTASEGGRRESGDWSEIPVSPPPGPPESSSLMRNGGDWTPSNTSKGSNWSDSTNHEWAELPPSPPLTRTALSRVKARSRSSSRSRVYKRSRSSPPSSRRSTLDSVRSEDLMMACCDLEEDEEQSNSSSHLQSISSNNESPLIVELLENQVSLLRDQLDQNQSHPSTLLVIVERQENEIENLKSQLNAARTDVANAENELSRLRQEKAEASIREKQVEELLNTIQRTEQQRSKDLDDLEKMKKLYNRDKEMLECKLMETEAILRETAERCEMLSNELSDSHGNVEHLQLEVASLSDRLSQGIEENDRLYSRIRELEGKSSLSVSRDRGRSFDSLSDLTNIDLDRDLSTLDKERIMDEYDELRSRFEKAVLEIRAMRKELREANARQDALELEIIAHKQDAAGVNETNQAQVQLMAARIQDLTSKLGISEKQARTLKQKLTKAETRDKRRSLSLKGRESFQISQEMEEKLLDLENKISAIERGRCMSAPASACSSSSKESSPNPKKDKRKESKNLDRSRPRRKSLDSATSSEPMKVLIRLSTLETKVASVTAESLASDAEKDSSECSEAGASPNCELSFEILSRLRKLERVVGKSKRRLEKCLGSTQAEEKAEKCLREVNDILESCLECKKNQSNAQVVESVGVMVARLETILKDKLHELTKRRQTLAQNGQLDDREKAKLLAERIAFESIILQQIKCAIGRNHEKSAVLSELVETSQLVSSLKRKIHGTKPKTYQNSSYVQYLTKVLANRLVLVGGISPPKDTSKEVTAARGESLGFLLQKQSEIKELMRKYKEKNLRHLAEALATETFNLSKQEDLGKQIQVSSKKLLEDRRIREAWALAQETVSKELVQAEVSHVIIRCGQMYEQDITCITDTCLNFDSSTDVKLEAWTDEAQIRLRQEMELCIQELSDAYEDCLKSMKTNKCSIGSNYDSRQLLVDYADVIAHKALIDARISLLQESVRPITFTGNTFVSSLIKNDDVFSCLDDNLPNSLLLDSEFSYFYQQSVKECEEKITGRRSTREQLKIINQSLCNLEDDLTELGKSLKIKIGDDRIENFCKRNFSSGGNLDWPMICERCSHLREQIKKMSDSINGASCRQCCQLQETVRRLTVEHNQELETLKRNQEKDLMDIRSELENQRHSLTSQYEQEAANLRERARKLEHRLNAMDSEHSAHVNELRAAYQRSMSAELDTDAETRKRYKEEIKQLRALCEKGLLAMENSHRRIISDMEEKHRQELENLRIEKEQALSEETQATLAALDAMRKAHEHEVQKEIAKFKKEFLKQMQAREDIGALHKEHEVEMQEIKQDILSLSAKYSSKCVESAALEEKVGMLSKQLAQAQQHIMQLDARNKQLRAHLILETNDSGINDTLQLLRGRDNEMAEQREEIHRLQQQLKHGDTQQSSVLQTKQLQMNSSYAQQRARNEFLRTRSEEMKTTNEKRSSLDSSKFSYNIERLKQRLPFSSNLRGASDSSGSRDTSLERIGQDGVLITPLWDSLKQRSAVTHRYQGGTAAMRIRSTGEQRQESEQSEKQQHQTSYTNRNNTRRPSSFTSEPSALSVAELTRSPAVRWTSKTCRSVPSATIPNYRHTLHPQLPAVGMVAERKKRFEI